MPLYHVTLREGGGDRLVDATTKSAALRHVAKDAFALKVATPMECVALGKDGVEIEKATAE